MDMLEVFNQVFLSNRLLLALLLGSPSAGFDQSFNTFVRLKLCLSRAAG